MSPSAVLFQSAYLPALLPVCDHYAGSEKLMCKSMALQREIGPQFDITFDCEDGAAAGTERAQAEMIGELIASSNNVYNRIGVRVQDIRHPCFEQSVQIICNLAATRLAYITLPKINSAAELKQAIATINRHAQNAGCAPCPIQVLIETQGALADVFEIARHAQVNALSFGIMDFISSHYGAIPAHAMQSPGQFSHPLVRRAKLEVAAACHAAGKVASHNVTIDIGNASVVGEDAIRARSEFGYTRMWSIHPNQIKPIVAAFRSSDMEIKDAVAILYSAQLNSWAPIQHNGKLHDRASYRYYWTILQRARASGQQLPDGAADLL